MKDIIMKEYMCNNGWNYTGNVKFRRVSRWIAVKQNYNPGPNNRLYDYCTDENGYKPYQEKFDPSNGKYLDYFRWNSRNYAIEQFWCLGNPFYTAVSYEYTDENGKSCWLSGVDSENIYNPIYVEFDEYCEHVRIYEYIGR